MQTIEAASPPRWDGARVMFQIQVGDAMVDCAISRSALQDIGGNRHYAAADLLRCFAHARPRIEAAAAQKFAAGAESVYGVVSLWSDDIEDAPLTEAEIAAQSKGKKHGKGNEPRQPRSQEAKGRQKATAGHIVIPAPDSVAAATGQAG